MSTEIDTYVERAPEAQRAALRELREMISAALPGAEVAIESGFPVYKVNGKWAAGFATRKKGPMLYIMASGVLDRHAQELGSLRSGNSCVEFRAKCDLSLDDVRRLSRQMLAEVGAAVHGV